MTRWRDGFPATATRVLADEVAVAITFNRETHAVMMATPADVEDFAVGFSLTEGVIDHAGQIEDLAILEVDDGIEARLWLDADRASAASARRRRLAGPTGCGLCGIDSLAEAVRPPRLIVGDLMVTPAMIFAAQAAMDAALPLGRETRAVHAAGLWHVTHGLLAVREDVGRHNALDKLVGAAARRNFRQREHVQPRHCEERLRRSNPGAAVAPGLPRRFAPRNDDAESVWTELARECVLLLSSRVSIEMVQKACVLGAPIVVAISAPTAHAVRLAEAANLTLVAVARADGFEVFSGGHRVSGVSHG